MGETKKSVRPAVSPRVKKVRMRELIDALSLSAFEGLGKALARKFELDVAIIKAGMTQHPIIYASRVLLFTFTSILFTVPSLVAYLLLVPSPLAIKLIVSVVASLVPVIIFTVGLIYPSILASSRKTMVENELPFFMSYISTMAKGNVSVDKVIERVAELKVFKALREEARRIILNLRFFGTDPLTAIERVIKYHPSTKFRDVMLGYITTLRSGGDVVHYLEIRTQELFASRMSELRMVIERLGSFLEFYIILGVIASITIFVFFSVSGALAVAGASAGRPQFQQFDLTTPSLYNFLGLPLMGFTILMLIHVMQPKTPVRRGTPYVVLITTIPFAVITFFMTLFITGGGGILEGKLSLDDVKSVMISTLMAVLVTSVPPWITYSKEMRGSKGLIKSTADFLRDLSEVRKTGLSPEKCIISLAQRDYRNLTPIVKKAAAALISGMNLEAALKRILRKTREWFVLAIFRFLADSITVGGGSPEVIDALARFTQNLAEVEEETRKRLRAYIALPYFGTILLSASPIIIVNLLTRAAEGVTGDQLAPLILVLGLGAIINSYIMGLVAGKVSEMSIAAGFKHVAIMVSLATGTILATLSLMGL